MTKTTTAKVLGALVLGLTVQACAKDAIAPVDQGGTISSTITGGGDFTVTKTAEAYWERSSTYDWTIEKSVTPSSHVLGTGESATFNYTIEVVRGEETSSDVYGMRGLVCVKNIGTTDSQLMRVVDRFYGFVGGVLTELKEVEVDISSHPTLLAGTEHCYPYNIVMEADFFANAEGPFKNVAYVYETVGGVETRRVQTQPVPVEWPTGPTAGALVDETASVVDALTCPTGFTCTPAGANWTFGASASQPLEVVVKNVSAPCNGTFTVLNSATLTEDDSQQVRGPATATGTVTTPSCEEWSGETAVGAGSRYPGSKNWFMYTPYSTSKVDLIAGQHYDAGDIYMSRSGGVTTIRITLTGTFRWAENTSEVLKIQPFNSAPLFLPSIGSFLYKFTLPSTAKTAGSTVSVSGNTVTVTMPGTSAKFYGIHGDVERLIQ